MTQYMMSKAEAAATVTAVAQRFPGGQLSANGLSYRNDNYPGAGGVVAITATPSPRRKADGSRMWRTINFA